MRGLSQESALNRALEGVGKGPVQEGSHRIRGGTSLSIWAAKHQNRTAKGRPSGRLCLCAVPLLSIWWYRAGGRAEESKVKWNIRASLHLIIHCL